MQRPVTLPGYSGNRPGGNRPGNRPGNKPNRPGDRPNRPGNGDRPGSGRPNRPGDRPNRPGEGNRPGNRPNRPGHRPNRPGNRPDFADRHRPGYRDRNRWNNNKIINNRPRWANIDNSTNINIHNRWNNAFVNSNRGNWWNASGNRRGYWNGWGNGVRNNWRGYGYQGNWFGNGWWDNHYHDLGGWHYHNWNHNYGWNHWWTVPAWGALTNWFTWSAPVTAWSQPVYYDYGAGGNVTYQDNSVYIGGTEVATADEFAASAMDLATVAPPESEEEAEATEWMPLGTFAVSMNEKDVQPSLTMQLAVNRDGIISGTLYNIDTDQAQTVQGKVDKETQRAAFRIGDNEDIVAETGLYNLTQEEAPLLIHFGTERVENYLLVRLEQPE
ncbi:hypothetical protein Mal52_09230 [Symmachiella dynata]|uniref:Mu-protocadherin-cell-suface protein n=1 Tax=Symmachiella dynata TaxID=2527995 RepID=A0A517ZJ00_9PLAN|nr:hypothetical protein [Symmachiella dynata]QDU42462.1 hypothetical protein Mal52_09230 [Symmachiella dynata]